MNLAPAIFGNLTIDDLVYADGTTRWAVPGGTAAYAALGAALWTGSAAAVAPMGEDYPTALLRGVDCSRCRVLPNTMRNWGLYEDDGSRQFISRHRDRDWLSFCPTAEDVATGKQAAAHLAAMPLHRLRSLIAALRQQGATTLSLDADNHDLQQDEASTNEHLDLVQSVDLYMPSQQDAARLLPGLSPSAALRTLRERAPQTTLIVLKMGAAGLLAHVAGSAHTLYLPTSANRVVDTTGAGDAFCGGALSAFAMGGDPVEAILQGSIAAALCVEGAGWEGMVEVTAQEKSRRLDIARRQLTATQV